MKPVDPPSIPADRRAWYLGCTAAEVAPRALLVGDPQRVERIARRLDEVRRPPEQRGLATVSGRFRGCPVTVSAFGMGAPIAAIVMHELFDLGVRRFIRIGTAMATAPVELGDFVLADAAYRGEGTSASYARAGYPASADFELGVEMRRALRVLGSRPWHAGLFGSYDGFYTEMFALDETRPRPSQALLADFDELGLLAADMETSALLTAGRRLGAQTASLCVASVDAKSRRKLDAERMAAAEQDLFTVALAALVAGAPERGLP
ncbi:MAG: nucleoside phosphorylase [Burkholderiales bacterium]|nr:nucleoside phosphorylase [Burkholderiales bacterium]MDE2395618.1 nucleoside phosphorylase [Burkholderiales bacterium]MDE2457093.1 nucleoside phosphorylase [Burkholderiales bacterium]